jgi:hypothetical protein
VAGGQVQDHHEGHAATAGQRLEEMLESVNAARGRANPDDGECTGCHRNRPLITVRAPETIARA